MKNKKNLYHLSLYLIITLSSSQLISGKERTVKIPRIVEIQSSWNQIKKVSNDYLYEPIFEPYVKRIKSAQISRKEYWILGSSLLVWQLAPSITSAIRSKSIFSGILNANAKSLLKGTANKSGIYFFNRITASKTEEKRLTPLTKEELTEFEKNASAIQKKFLELPFEKFQNTILYGPPGTGKTTLIRARAAKYPNEKIIEFPPEIFNLHLAWQEGRIKYDQFMKSIQYETNKLITRIKNHCNADKNNRVLLFIEEADSIKISKKIHGINRRDIKKAFSSQRTEKAKSFSPKDLPTAINELAEITISGLGKDSTYTPAIKRFLNIFKEMENQSDEFYLNDSEETSATRLAAQILAGLNKYGDQDNWVTMIKPKLINWVNNYEKKHNITITDKDQVIENQLESTVQKLKENYLDYYKHWLTTHNVWRNIYEDGAGKVAEKLLLANLTLLDLAIRKFGFVFLELFYFLILENNSTREKEYEQKPIEIIEKGLTTFLSGFWQYRKGIKSKNMKKGTLAPFLTTREDKDTEKRKKQSGRSPIPFLNTFAYICQKSDTLTSILPPHFLLLIPRGLGIIHWNLFADNNSEDTVNILNKIRLIVTTNDRFSLDPAFLNDNEYGKCFTHTKIGRPQVQDLEKVVKQYNNKNFKTLQLSKEETLSIAEDLYLHRASYRQAHWVLKQIQLECSKPAIFTRIAKGIETIEKQYRERRKIQNNYVA